ncbi:MAG: prolipoprotein diacylglyceryl transferase family protein, partial [Thermoguttaceae bacterium]
VWVVFSAAVLGYLVWKQGFSADTWGYLPVLLLIAAAIVWMLPAICDERGLPIRGYGVMNLLAVLCAVWLATWRAKRVGLNPELIYSLALWMLIPGIILARSFYVIQYWSTQYWPVYQGMALFAAVINIAQGGMVVYGAFLGGTLGMLAFARREKLPLLALADLVAPSLVLGLAIGRIGCLMTGCCYGGVCDLPWAITFPRSSPAYLDQIQRGQIPAYGFTLRNDTERPDAPPMVLTVDPASSAARAGLKPGELLLKINGYACANVKEAYECILQSVAYKLPLKIETASKECLLPTGDLAPRSLPVHPTQIYSSIGAFILCVLLLASEPFLRRDGALFALLVSIYSVSRFLIEILRTDEAPKFGTGMTISQNISIVLFVFAAGLWVYILMRAPGKFFARHCQNNVSD